MRDDRPIFGRVLRRLRERAGHSSAREFYRTSGGKPFFGCTYEQYAHVESGRSAPGAQLAERAATALRVWQFEATAREYFTSYLRASLRSDKLVEMIAASFAAKAGGENAPLRQAFRRNFEDRRRRLTEAQVKAIRKDDASFWCFNVLCCDDGYWSAEDLGEMLSLPRAAVARALAALAKTRLAAKDREGRWRAGSRGVIHAYPRRLPYKPDGLETLLARYDALEKRGGETEMYEGLLLRASPRALRHYFGYLAQSVLGSGVYAADEPGERALYLVEGRVRRLADLPGR